MFNSFDICERLGEKLGEPDRIQSLFERADLSQSREGLELSLAYGWPGLALFYSVLNEIFPNEAYERCSHLYLERSVAKIETMNFLPLSLFLGLSGLCFTVHACSKEGLKYRQLLNELDRLLIDKLEEHFSWIEENPFPETYHLAHGISGSLAYFISRQTNPFLLKYAKKCLSKLIELLKREPTVLGSSVPGWYEPPEEHWSEREKNRFPHGKFSPSYLFGIAGVAASLSLAKLEGMQVDGLTETLARIADWLKNKRTAAPNALRWPRAVALEEEMGNDPSSEGYEEDTLFIARSLYLAGKALNRKDLKACAEETSVRFEREKNPDDLSFLSGKAGDLAILYHMSRESQSPLLFKKTREIETALTNAFNPSQPLGFFPEEGEEKVGIAKGAAGIVLSLLLVQDRGVTKWDRMFLLR
jgi:hypothetical protein